VRRCLVLIVLLAGFPAAVVASAFSHGPYSGAPACDAVTICWVCTENLPARIEYGTRVQYEVDGTLSESLDVPFPQHGGADTVHVRLDGLQPNTDYAYRVVLTEGTAEHASPLGAFSTEPPPGEPVAFAVLADTQWQSEGANRLEMVGDAIAADPLTFDFVLHAGDVVESPSPSCWDHWFASFNDMLLRAPFIPVLGNHEENHRSYYETFSFPPGAGKNGKRWWALHWGDVVVVGLDTNVKQAADIAEQQDWVSAHLAGPEPHKFVIFHHPVFSSDVYHGGSSFLDKIYHPIFVERGVDIVFNGHSHHYEHIVRDSVTYLIVGGGGAIPRTTVPERIQGSKLSVEGHYFYVRVIASTDGIDVETVSVARETDGTAIPTPDRLLDTFTLPALEVVEPLPLGTKAQIDGLLDVCRFQSNG